MKVKILSFTNKGEYENVAELTRPTIESYCNKYGFHNKIIQGAAHDLQWPPSWVKIPLLRQALIEGYDIAMWIDADAIILNDTIDVRDLIDDNIFYVSKDVNGINAGVMIWKNCQDAQDFLSKIDSMHEYYSHKWWEQGAIMKLWDNNFLGIQSKTKFIDQKIFNAYDYSLYNIECLEGQYGLDSFILHLPGTTIETKISKIKEVLNEKNTTSHS